MGKKLEIGNSCHQIGMSNIKVSIIVFVSDPVQGAALLSVPTAERAGVGRGRMAIYKQEVVFHGKNEDSSSNECFERI